MRARTRAEIRRLILRRLIPLGLSFVAVSAGLYLLLGQPDRPKTGRGSTLRVLSYSSFINSWGPGPEIAKLFEEHTGIRVEFQTADDAGLLLKKLELLPADFVIGFDQLSIGEARKTRKWRPVAEEIKAMGNRWLEPEFLPIDWGPMTFIYRKGEIEPPTSLDDLLDPRFKGAIALQDPRTSTPGLQFLMWVLDEKGVEEGFAFLEKLRPNIHSVSGSWSAAYGAFTKKQAKIVFSYLTSPVYHWTEEKDESYRPALFAEGHPVQIEYGAIPDSCENCEAARLFSEFLYDPRVQTILMKKNYMFPMLTPVITGTEFAKLPQAKIREWKSMPILLEQRIGLFERWRKLGL